MARLETFVALGAAFLVNAAILIMSASIFFRNGHVVTELEEAYKTLIPLVGPLAGTVFAIALLASGLSSSVTGTMAGQIVMEEFLHLRLAPWKRRIITRGLLVVPTFIALAMGFSPLDLLIFSQIALSILLPIAIVPLIDFTRRKKLMGEFRNKRLTTIVASAILIFLVCANAAALWATIASA
jgi:manganese transport protein